MIKRLLLILALVLALCVPASAGYLDFGIDLTAGTNGGTIVYNPVGSGRVIGTNIEVDNVIGVGTPSNPGSPLTITGGDLDFASADGVGNPTFDSTTWTWTGPGSIMIHGGIAALGVANGSLLMSGTFSNVQVHKVTGGFLVSTSVFVDTKNDHLETYYGYAGSTPWIGEFNIGFLVDNNPIPPAAFASTAITSGDILNHPVPLPPSALLLGSGLLGLLGFGLRKK